MKKVAYHIAFWSAYVAFNSILNKILQSYFGNEFYLSDQINKYVFAIAFFYYVYYVLFSYRKVWLKIVLYVLGIVAFYALQYITYKYILPVAFDYPHVTELNLPLFTNRIWWWMHYTIYAYFYWLYFKNIDRIKTVNELRSQNLELQTQKLKIQYNFLKAQINPHFLYNTLSFFYSKTLTNDKQTAEGIALLTDIMRYSLQPGGEDGRVELEDEITHLTNYIELQQMRFSNKLNIQFTKNIDQGHYRVLPHILITLVENAFKHGEINNPLHPLRIELTVKQNNLFFTVENKIRRGPRDQHSTGVGVSNIYERLKMEYGDSVRLDTKNDDNFFTVSLSITFHTNDRSESNRKKKISVTS